MTHVCGGHDNPSTMMRQELENELAKKVAEKEELKKQRKRFREVDPEYKRNPDYIVLGKRDATLRQQISRLNKDIESGRKKVHRSSTFDLEDIVKIFIWLLTHIEVSLTSVPKITNALQGQYAKMTKSILTGIIRRGVDGIIDGGKLRTFQEIIKDEGKRRMTLEKLEGMLQGKLSRAENDPGSESSADEGYTLYDEQKQPADFDKQRSSQSSSHFSKLMSKFDEDTGLDVANRWVAQQEVSMDCLSIVSTGVSASDSSGEHHFIAEYDSYSDLDIENISFEMGIRREIAFPSDGEDFIW